MIDLSVIIVNWNTKELLRKCVESIICETVQYSMEIIVVDNASSDGSPEMVHQVLPEVKLIVNEENLGFAKANNIGIRQSTGRYICLVNSDIEVLKNALDKMVFYMDQNKTIGLLGPKTLNADLSLRKNCRTFPSLWSVFCQAIGLSRIFSNIPIFSDGLMTYFSHEEIRNVDVLPGCFLLSRKKAVDAVGGLDENFFFYGEDKDWCKSFKDSGWDTFFYPNAEVIHFAGKSSTATPVRIIIERLKSNIYYWRKHHSKFELISYCGLLLLHHSIRFIGYSSLYFFRPKNKLTYADQIKTALISLKWLVFRTKLI